MQCGYIIIPADLVSKTVKREFDNGDYVHSLDPIPLAGYATTTYEADINTPLPNCN